MVSSHPLVFDLQAKDILSAHSSKFLSPPSQVRYSSVSAASKRSWCKASKLYARAPVQSAEALCESPSAKQAKEFQQKRYTAQILYHRVEERRTLPCCAPSAFLLSDLTGSHPYFFMIISNFWEGACSVHYGNLPILKGSSGSCRLLCSKLRVLPWYHRCRKQDRNAGAAGILWV